MTDPAAHEEKLKRETAGRYVTADGRFAVEQSSGRWMLTDTEQTDDLGLPLVRGLFATLDAARDAIGDARSGPAPTSQLAARIAGLPKRTGGVVAKTSAKAKGSDPAGKAATAATPAATAATPAASAKPRTAPVELRELRPGDGAAVRALWADVGFKSLGDDDPSLAVFAKRNPGLLRVAVEGDRVVASALGAWDGRRGWIYHVATAPDHRRKGLARRLVRDVERRLGDLGCRKANVIVRDASEGGAEFWAAMGYKTAPVRQFGKEI
jgi:ribosomal protein S18 acetylase RimI-like enzyme